MAIIKILNGGGRYFNDDAPELLINYILDSRKTLSGYYGGSIPCEFATKRMHETCEKFGKTDGIKVRHFILSFRPYEIGSPSDVDDIARYVIEYFGGEYEIVYGVHENRRILHVHFAMNNVSFVDGHRYRGTKKEFYAFLDKLAKMLYECYDIRNLDFVSVK